MSLRKTACAACVKAKKRCDLRAPACGRCTDRAQECVYPYPRDLASAPAPSDTPGGWFDSSISGTDTLGGFPGSPPGLWDALQQPFTDADVDFIETGLDLPRTVAQCEDGSMQNFQNWLPGFPGLTSRPWIDSQREQSRSSQNVLESREQAKGMNTGPYMVDDFGSTTTMTSFCLPTWHTERQSVPTSLPAVWPRALENDTWMFCAREMFSYIGLFARTVSTPFIRPPTGYFCDPLQSAYGVCSAYATITKASRPFFEELLCNKVDELSNDTIPCGSATMSSSFNDTNTFEPANLVQVLRTDLARLQAMLLYYIISAFGSCSQTRLLAEKQEPRLAALTAEVQFRFQALEIQQSPTGSEKSSTRESSLRNLREEECESLYHTILMSYFARCVHSVLRYQTCRGLVEMTVLPIVTPARLPGNYTPRSSGKTTVGYQEFAELWDQGRVTALDESDRFMKLLLVACKGLDSRIAV